MKKTKTKLETPKRVKIWNSYFKLARSEAGELWKILKNKDAEEISFQGGVLSDKELHSLATLLLCSLAIEARANHPLDVLVEEKKITGKAAEKARWLPLKEKWFKLPRLAGVPKKLDSGRGCHQAIATIAEWRNDLVHTVYDNLARKKLPTPEVTVSLFKKFVEAMEDMNVVLFPDEVKKARPEVLKIGIFSPVN